MGTAPATRRAWQQAYRSFDHKYAKEQCGKAANAGFSQSLVDFADLFRALQIERHDADYDPFSRFARGDVLARVAQAEAALAGLKAVPLPERRAFAVWVSIKTR